LLAFDAFFRFTACAFEAWTPQFKSLIPDAIRPKVIEYVKNRSKQQGSQGQPAQQAATEARVIIIGDAQGATGAALDAKLLAEAQQLTQAVQDEQQQLSISIAASTSMQNILQLHSSSIAFAGSELHGQQ
jgi:hypothetical protein